MGCSNDLGLGAIACRSHEEIAFDYMRAIQKLNIDFSPHWMFIQMYMHDLTICSYGLTIKWKEFEFDAAIQNKETAILIKSGTDLYKIVPRKGLHQIVMAAYNKRDEESEKVFWREKLRASGVNPEW